MQISLFIWYVCLLALTFILAVSAVPVKEENELQNDANCKALCQHCGCIGFYCGEECICECNGDNKEDMECLATMQSNCKKMNIPFEVLIQGPSENRFIRSALLLDKEIKQCSAHDRRSKRSTAVIYKPGLKAPLANALINIRNAKIAEKTSIKNLTSSAVHKTKESGIKSHKRRGIKFMDENNFLVAPAPRRHFVQHQPHQDLMTSGSENMLNGLALPGGNFQIGNAVVKMREALQNLNAKTEQLLNAAQLPPALQLPPNLLNLLPPTTPFSQPKEPEPLIPAASNTVGIPEDRRLLKSLLSNFPRLNNMLNN